MTKARLWPNVAKEQRDRAAEEVQLAIAVCQRLEDRVSRGDFTRDGLERDLLRVSLRLVRAIRFLETAGAVTRPE